MLNRQNKLLFSSLLFLFLFSCKPKNKAQNKSKEPPVNILAIKVPYSALDENEVEKWKSIIRSYYDTILSKKLNGQILIAKNGVVLFEAYIGSERLQQANTQPMNEHSSIHLASVSKTFTAAAILILQQMGKLNIEDPVSKYITAFPYPAITIKQLLNHRSGLANYVHNLENWGWKTNQMASNQDVLNLMIQNKVPLIFATDTKFNYCNTNYAMLALLIEKISGSSFGEFLKDYIFYPLQMNDTYVFLPKDTSTALPSYDWKKGMFPYNNLDEVYGDKNIYSTVRDLYKWDQALYTNQLLHAESKALAYAPYSNEKPGVKNYGLGWRMFNFPNNKKLIFHNGWWHGNNNAFIRLIEDSAVLICLGNQYSKTNYSVMQLSYLFGDYPFEYEVEEKDTAKANELLLLNQLKLRADSLKTIKKMQWKKDSIQGRKDSLQFRKDSLRMIKPKEIKISKDTMSGIKETKS